MVKLLSKYPTHLILTLLNGLLKNTRFIFIFYCFFLSLSNISLKLLFNLLVCLRYSFFRIVSIHHFTLREAWRNNLYLLKKKQKTRRLMRCKNLVKLSGYISDQIPNRLMIEQEIKFCIESFFFLFKWVPRRLDGYFLFPLWSKWPEGFDFLTSMHSAYHMRLDVLFCFSYFFVEKKQINHYWCYKLFSIYLIQNHTKRIGESENVYLFRRRATTSYSYPTRSRL